MNTPGATQEPRRRGRRRRRTPEAPCPDCIQRASLSNSRGDVRFCNDCARALGQGQARRRTDVPTTSIRTVISGRVEPRRTDYQRRATTNRHAAAVRAAQSLSPTVYRASQPPYESSFLSEAGQQLPLQSLSYPPPIIGGLRPDQASITFDLPQDHIIQDGLGALPLDSIPPNSMAPQYLTIPASTTISTEDEELRPTPRRSNIRPNRERLVQLPAMFEDLEQASNVLCPVHGRLAALILSIDNSDQVVTSFSQDTYRRRASEWLLAWEKAFAAFLAGNFALLTSDQQKAAMTLKAHHLIAECFAAVQPAETGLDWSTAKFEKSFKAILDLAVVVMTGVDESHLRLDGRRSRSIDHFQTTLPNISILDPVMEVEIRTTNIGLRDWARELRGVIQPQYIATTSAPLPQDPAQPTLLDSDSAITTR